MHRRLLFSSPPTIVSSQISTSVFAAIIMSSTSSCQHPKFSTGSYYVNKSKVFDWMKNHDSALQAELKRSSFLVFIDQNPLLRQSPSSKFVVPLIPHSKLVQLSATYGFKVDNESSALVDITPLQGGSNDTDEEFLPVLAINLRSSTFSATIGGSDSSSKLASELNGEVVDGRRAMFLITEQTSLHLLAKSQALLRWVHSTRFCTKCAAPLEQKLSKSSAKCTNCSKEFHPTISPVAITLITNEKNDHVMLVRQPRHPPGMYSAVAGFAEMGEPIEHTVRREIAEEVGMEVESIKYASSQPWPFPEMSLMLGFHAIVKGMPEPHVDAHELEDAHWFTRDEVKTAFTNSLKLQSDPWSMKDDRDDSKSIQNRPRLNLVPPAGALAHDLIKWWLNEGDSKL